MCVLLIIQILWLVGRLGSNKPVSLNSWLAVATPTDSPKLVCNCCVIVVFGDVYVLSLYPFKFSAGIEAFFIRQSQISSLFSVNTIETKQLCGSPSNFAHMSTMMRGWTPLILEVKG